MNKRILEVLEYQQVKMQIAQYLTTDQGLEILDKLHPIAKKEKLDNWLAETFEAMEILRLKGGIPIPRLESITPHMKRIEIGANLNGQELAQVTKVLTTTQELVTFFEELKEADLPLARMYHWAEQLTYLPALTKELKLAIDEDGRVNDEASEVLRNLRRQIRQSEQTIRETLDGLIRGKNARYLSDTLVTMRNDRYVIPVKQEYQGIFGGVVHDQSASGQTLFIEPKQVLELNNRLRQQQIAKRAEIERILAELSAKLVPNRKEIAHNATVLAFYDFMNAKARHAKELKACVPVIHPQNEISLKKARHPLIDAKKVVANDIFIGKDFQTIVITGPNTGGKTITLKTLGLLQLMAQSGLAIPVDEESQVGLFDEVFADIGDEQSIEQNLSTFSSHMTNIVSILNKANDKSLILLDELGAGTDPQEGAALAISILDELQKRNSFVVATTHYPELKAYGYNRKRTINASMEFDVDTLSPTYRLLIGVPGRSNAFEISRRLGLASPIIEQAKQILDGETQDLNEMIADLENRRKMTETEYLELRHHVTEAEQLHHDLKVAYEAFFEEREVELTKARKQANELVEKAQEEADTIIADIRKMQLLQGQGNVKEHQLIEAKTKLADLHQEDHLKKNKVLQKAKKQKAFKPGDEVMVAQYGQRGTLLQKVDNQHWQVQMGILKMTIAQEELQATDPVKEEPKRVIHTVRSSQTSHVDPQLDLRGKRYEEALSEVDQYIDAAILAGYPQVRIVHGKGTGALRQGITKYLQNHRSVASFEFAPANQGGNGATIVKFK